MRNIREGHSGEVISYSRLHHLPSHYGGKTQMRSGAAGLWRDMGVKQYQATRFRLSWYLDTCVEYVTPLT